MGNLDHWSKFEDIDPAFTKPITGKAYKGTSPNPQYVIRCLTELFGPVGEGFGWDVVAEEFTPLGDEVLHWCRIRFWHGKRENHWDSYGQTKALMKTRNGLMSDEDAPKKSLTDAIIKAASQLGIAANIFLGRWDDQKHVQEVTEKYRAENGLTSDQPADPKPRQIAKAEPSDADLLRNKMVAGLREKGAGLADFAPFKADLERLRKLAPELAASVEAEIETQKQGAAA